MIRFFKLSLCTLAVVCLLAACGQEDTPPAPTPQSVPGPPPPSFDVKTLRAQAAEWRRERFPDRPNIVWIVLDACRAENLSCMGNTRQTSPTIDALAARGALFENHFAQGLWTELSTPSYMTGRYFPVAALDVSRNYPSRDRPEGEFLFPNLLTEFEYRTGGFTSHAMLTYNTPLARAFDSFHLFLPDAEENSPYVSFERLNASVRPWLERAVGAPFFLYLHTLDTHFPHRLDPPNDEWSAPIGPTPQIPNGQPVKNFGLHFDETDKALLAALHDGAIYYADAQIQVLLDHLDELDILDQTIIVISSDHGDALGEDGESWGHWRSFDEVMHVPLIIAGPGVPEGVRISSLTENVDIVPTLLDVINLTPFVLPDGKSLLPLMEDPGAPPLRSHAFARYSHHEYDGMPGLILRTPDYKYELDMGRNEEHLWAVPDRVGARNDLIAEFPGEAARLRTILEQDYLPRWKAYMALDKISRDIRIDTDMLATHEENADTVVISTDDTMAESSLSDGKWLFHDGTLWAAGWAERVPPLSLTMNVEPGRYIVEAEIFSDQNFRGHPATSLLIMVEDDYTPRSVNFYPVDQYATGYEFRELGTYTIDDGTLDVILYDDDRAYWSAIRGFRLIPVADTPNPLGLSAPNAVVEQLRALGYME